MAQIILDSNNNLIQGDFDNATLNNRTKLQTTTTNATTNVYVVPNGSSTSAGVSVANNSSLTNASKIVMATNGTTDTQIISGVNGSGTYLPMSFYVNNALAMQISTAGVVSAAGGFAGAGMTLLGTLTTTSGTTQTLSGLTLTNYKYLFFVFLNVGWTTGATVLVKASTTVGLARDSNTGAESISGNLMLDLSTGVYSSMTARHTAGTTEQQGLGGAVASGIIPSWNTSTTSLSFGSSPSYTFTSGTIKVYGVS